MTPQLSLEYSDALDNVFRDLHGANALVQPQIDFSSREYRSLLNRFNAYKKGAPDHESLPPLRLYTCYRGVPFDAPVEVVNVDEEFVDVRVTRRQAKVLARRGFAMVESPVHGTAFRAFTSDVDEQACLASFSHFVPDYTLSDLRTQMRVEPSAPTSVTVSRHDKAATGQLIDLSELAIAVSYRDFNATGFTQDTTIDVAITLPLADGDCDVETTGTIVKVAPSPLGNFSEQRVVIKLSPDDGIRAVFARYIAQRQEEVYTELGTD